MFNTSPDFELPVDADMDNVYVVTVEATDVSGNSSQQTISITVVDVNEQPIDIVLLRDTVPENEPGAVVGRLVTLDQDAALTVFEEMGFRREAMLLDHVKDKEGKDHDILILSQNVDGFASQLQAYGLIEQD